MGFPHLIVILLSISPSLIQAQMTDQPATDESSMDNLPQSNSIESTPSDLYLSSTIPEEPLSSDSPSGPVKSQALSTGNETSVLAEPQNQNEESTRSHTTQQETSTRMSTVTGGGANNVLGASEPDASIASSTTAHEMSTAEPEATSVEGRRSSIATTPQDDDNSTSEHGISQDYDHPRGNGDVTQTYGRDTNINTTASKPRNKDLEKFIIIVVIIIILVLLSVFMMVMVIRKKRRSGSQNFHTQSRKSNRQDVWAGQAPEMGDGKMLQEAPAAENGSTRMRQDPGKEMTTFVSGEKKADSLVEMEEILPVNGAAVKGAEEQDHMGEQRPLLEGSSEGAGEVIEAPVGSHSPEELV